MNYIEYSFILQNFLRHSRIATLCQSVVEFIMLLALSGLYCSTVPMELIRRTYGKQFDSSSWFFNIHGLWSSTTIHLTRINGFLWHVHRRALREIARVICFTEGRALWYLFLRESIASVVYHVYRFKKDWNHVDIIMCRPISGQTTEM